MAHKSLWRLAATPKWIAGLLLALAIASGFAWLGQWQLGRAVETNKPIQLVKTATLDVMLDTQSVFVVRNRIQNGKTGYWVIANSTSANNESHILAIGWTENLAKAKSASAAIRDSIVAQAFLPVSGELLPNEAPEKIGSDGILESVATSQLANLVKGEQKMQVDYLAVDAKATANGLQTIHAEISQEAGINWLSAFYAVEWSVFAGFAVFMWWRMLKDSRDAKALN